MDTVAIILAAGEGRRMKSKLPKVLHEVCGKAMIDRVISATRTVCRSAAVIVSNDGARVAEHIGGSADIIYQGTSYYGTGYAVQCAQDYIARHSGRVLITASDMPAVLPETLQRLAACPAKAALLTVERENPTGYGRIIRGSGGEIQKIVEENNCNDEQRKIKECNASVYCFDISALLGVLNKLEVNSVSNEIYLTDAIELLIQNGETVCSVSAEDTDECQGINDRIELANVENIIRGRNIKKHMLAGVTIIDPGNVIIHDDVQIGADCVIYPGNTLTGSTKIGDDCLLLPGNRIHNGDIGANTVLEHCVLLDAEIGEHTAVGPFAYIRPNSKIGNHCKVGDFVEIKNSSVGNNTKISHLTYVGDSDLGSDINLGCGVVFVNYDGKHKHRSRVGDSAFIGCNVNIVSPVNIGSGAYIAAGSTITEDVPSEALAIARQRQTNKEQWVRKKKTEGKL